MLHSALKCSWDLVCERSETFVGFFFFVCAFKFFKTRRGVDGLKEIYETIENISHQSFQDVVSFQPMCAGVVFHDCYLKVVQHTHTHAVKPKPCRQHLVLRWETFELKSILL